MTVVQQACQLVAIDTIIGGPPCPMVDHWLGDLGLLAC